MIVRLKVSNFDCLADGGFTLSNDPSVIPRVMARLLERKFRCDSVGFQAGIEGQPSTINVAFEDPMEAAIFLATISADPERAAMFKMFWSGE